MNLATSAALTTATPTRFALGNWLHALVAHTVAPTRPSAQTQYFPQEIAKNDIREVKQAFGVTIECLAGSVWVTLDGDQRDVVLDAGQVFVVDRNQRTLLQALSTASVRLIKPVHAQ